MHKFMIHFQSAAYSNELYDVFGRNIYSLEKAIKTAEDMYGSKGWEVYNGIESENRFR